MGASVRLKRTVGRFFLTKRRVLGVFGEAKRAQVRLSHQIADSVMAPHELPVGQVITYLQSPQAQEALGRAADQHAVFETGLTIEELKAVMQAPDWARDAAFRRAFDALSRESEALMERSDGDLMRKVEAYKAEMESGVFQGRHAQEDGGDEEDGEGGGGAGGDGDDEDDGDEAAQGGGGGGGGPANAETRRMVQQVVEFARLPSAVRARVPQRQREALEAAAEQIGIPLAP